MRLQNVLILKMKKNSWELVFSINKKSSKYLVEKGSVCINGTSLTCFNVGENNFSVVRKINYPSEAP